MGNFYQRHYHGSGKNQCRRESGKTVRTKRMGGCYEMLSSGHDMVIALMNSIQHRLPEQDLHEVKPKPLNIPAGGANWFNES